MSEKVGVLQRLYLGTGAFDIVGRRKRFYLVSAVLLLVCIGSIVFRGFNLGIDFEGGTKVSLLARGAAGGISTEQVEDVFKDTLNRDPATVQSVGVGDSATIQIRSETLNSGEVARLKDALFEELQPLDGQGNPNESAINDSAVSASWGGEISQQALIALAVFLALVTVFLAVYFERWMALAAIIALAHDVAMTVGVYSLVGFEVTPASVIGLLTILGYSLYDTVVVFDKVRENTRGLLGLTRRTFAEAANLALNQTLMRSINTTLSSVLPVAALLVIGAGLLGVGTLNDLALVMLVGLLAGTYSSIFIATPVLAELKMRDPRFQQQAQRVKSRRENLARKAAERETAGAPVEEVTDESAPSTDDESLDAELRQERAMAAASSVPARNPKAAETARRRSTRSGRPSGKRKR